MITGIKYKVKELIAANKTEATLKLLLDYYQSKEDDSKYDEILLQSSKYKELVSSHRKGIISREDYMTMLARVNLALVQIVNNEELGTGNTEVVKEKETRIKNKNNERGRQKNIRTVLQVVFVFLLVGFLGMQLYSYIYTTQQLTVYVHGEKGRQDIIPNLDASLILDFGNDRRDAEVGEMGRTNFGEIPKKFMNKPLSISLESEEYEVAEGYGQIQYTGEPVYLEVRNKAPNAQISGIVLDRNSLELLEGVSIIVDSVVVVTDSFGKFRLETPKSQTGKHLVIFSKEGYATKREYYIETPNPIEIRLTKLQDQ